MSWQTGSGGTASLPSNDDNHDIEVNGRISLKSTSFTLLETPYLRDGIYGEAMRDWTVGASADVRHIIVSPPCSANALATRN